MVILDQGIETVTILFSQDITQGQWGSGTALAVVGDTGLKIPIAATLSDTTVTTSGKSVQFITTVPSTIGNGSSFAEYELKFSGGTSFNRSVGATFNKTNSFEVVTITTVNFSRG